MGSNIACAGVSYRKLLFGLSRPGIARTRQIDMEAVRIRQPPV